MSALYEMDRREFVKGKHGAFRLARREVGATVILASFLNCRFWEGVLRSWTGTAIHPVAGASRPRKDLSGGLSWFLPEHRRHQCRRVKRCCEAEYRPYSPVRNRAGARI